uniref:Protein sleepless n=1 Tax=Syphacia muris TaxID=451379 RepID=A0A0N5ADW5_9BILA
MRLGILSVFVLLSGISTIINATTVCRFCATPGLDQIWEVTGLKRPGDIDFVDACFKYGMDDITRTCPGKCLDYFFSYSENSTTRNYGLVRGCYDLLVGANVTTDQCSYYEFSDHSQTILLNTVELHIDYTAFSVYTEEGQQNQGKLTFSSDGNISFPTECKKEEQSYTCKLCNELNGDDCGPKIKNTCTGPYCTKTITVLHGQTWISRGCAPVNIYQEENCFNSAAAVKVIRPIPESARNRRDISYEAANSTICYCIGNECNGASTNVGILSMTILSLIASYFVVSKVQLSLITSIRLLHGLFAGFLQIMRFFFKDLPSFILDNLRLCDTDSASGISNTKYKYILQEARHGRYTPISVVEEANQQPDRPTVGSIDDVS